MIKITVPVAIVGCGDIGLRIAGKQDESTQISAIVASKSSKQRLENLGMDVQQIDLEQQVNAADCPEIFSECIYYLVPPQKEGVQDLRSRNFLNCLRQQDAISGLPRRIVLISTTGVYGDCAGDWVNEQTSVSPGTQRGQRRLDMEQQWLAYADDHGHILSILRVPGIYSHSRLPRERLLRREPVVDPKECGYTNRIHADDLAMICIGVMQQQKKTDIYNVADGIPGTISDYLLSAAKELDIPVPPIISMQDAQSCLSSGMLSYLRESRRIDNSKLFSQFDLTLQYPDYRMGMKF